MKTVLNIILAIMVYLIYCDIEKNLNNPELYYENTLVGLVGIVFFGFFRIYWDEFINHLESRKHDRN